MRKYILLCFSLLLFTACAKDTDNSRLVNVTLTNACTNENESGDYAFDFCVGGYAGYKTDSGDRGAAKATVVEEGKMTASFRLNSEASSMWCYSGGAIGMVQTFTVPSTLTKESVDMTSDFAAMVYCSKEVPIDGKDNVEVAVNSVTSGLVLEIFDSSGKFAGKGITSVVLSADNEAVVAGSVSLNFEKAGISAISEPTSDIAVQCTNIKVGTEDNPTSVGVVLIPCSFTGNVTVSGPGYTSVTEIGTPLHFQAGYVKTLSVDLSVAQVSEPLKIGVIGDSISSFEGMIPDGYKYYYPKSSDVDSWEKTYWGLLITNYWQGILDINCSYSGGCVAPCSAKPSGSDFITRARDFIDPDIVLLHGGTNDAIASNGIEQGDFDYDSPFGSMKTWERFRDSYIAVIKYIRANHPEAKIIVVLGDHVTGGFADSIVEIASHFKLPLVDFRGDSNVSKYSGSHPDAAGMAYMAQKIYDDTYDRIF